MRLIPRVVSVFLLFVAVAGAAVHSASAATSLIQFGRIQYDSPGSDTGTNASLNAEYFVVRNNSTIVRNLQSFTVRDAQAHVYTFAAFNLGAGKAVKVHTGKGTNTATDRFWGKTAYVWNNGGDTATMRNASGVTIDTCAWTSVGLGYKSC
jgi:hypothetical protein